MVAALITGASRGIGAAAARKLAANGYDLLLLARSLPDLETLADELRPLGRTVEVAAIDLADAAAIPVGLDQLCSRGLLPQLVINNAGVAYTGALASMPLSQWQWLFQLNVTSVFQVCQAVLPHLRAAGRGHIINVSSHAAHQAFPDWGAYCASKAALVSFSRCLAVEERTHGIRVSTLTLGAVNSSLWDSETVHSDFDRRAMLDPEQAADALLFLAQQPATQVVEDLTLMPAAGAL
ncbi:SDR family oxidoreductase [Synechococcus sp. CCY9201]|uniref:SDR family oxidoreductase n=1 Tax=unclassified Synechococcus TaxID=2626047 RepID=UPI002AD4ABF5|nr:MULTISPECIES: SDR family oxidoreductase [unclassified Synechococcus]MEA5424111.1 SDR family oxidoreductase [Synechococcus sp. CCY9202]MEA5475606.1 SDR family oxidoreductase [Synechococcus sp. CCY9201]CAK6692115.1 Oxidoreductase UcpA [Synechococcus sp. CBW1107]